MKYKPSEREIVHYPSPEYRQFILDSKLLRAYDNSAKSREEHDETIRKVRESTIISDKVSMYRLIYGEEDYGERRA